MHRRELALLAALVTTLLAGSTPAAAAAETPPTCPSGTSDPGIPSLGFVRDEHGRFHSVVPDTGGKCLHKIQLAGANNRGQVVGGYRADGFYIGEGVVRNFVWQDDRVTDLHLPGLERPGVEVTASDINDAGEVVGSYLDVTTGAIHGFVRDSNGATTTLDHPDADGSQVLGGSGTQVMRINNRGDVLGNYVADGTILGFVRDRRGNFSTVRAPGAVATYVLGFNDHGDIAGVSSQSGAEDVLTGSPRGFLLEDGNFSEVSVPSATTSAPNALNNRGQIAGSYLDGASFGHAFLRDRQGDFDIINHPDASKYEGTGDSGFSGTFVYALNDRGLVAGSYTPSAEGPEAPQPPLARERRGWSSMLRRSPG